MSGGSNDRLAREVATRGLGFRLWQARGYLGGMVAIGLAAMGQQAILTRSDMNEGGRYYLAAFVLLILSMLRPNIPARLRQIVRREGATIRNAATGQAPVAVETNRRHIEGIEVELAGELVPVAVPAQPSLSVRHAQQNATTLARASIPVRSVKKPTPTPSFESRRFSAWVPSQAEVAASNGAKSTPKPASLPEGFVRMLRRLRATDAASSVSSLGKKRGFRSRLASMRARLGWQITAIGLGITAVLAVASALLLQEDIGDTRGGWLWAAALVTLVISLVAISGRPSGSGLLPDPRNEFFTRGVPIITARWEALLIGVIMLAGFGLRLYNLESYPGVFGDEGERGMDARAILNGDNRPLFGTGWWIVPNIYFYLYSISLRVFGDDIFGARMLSVITGMVTVLYVYRIGRLLWGVRAGMIAGALLAVSPLWLQYSRQAGESTPTAMLWAIGFYYFFLALRNRKWSDWALAGIFWAFSLYFYAAGKLIVPLVALVGLYCLVRWRSQFFKRYVLGFVLLGASFALTFMPFAIFSIKDNWQAFTGRAQETSIFSPVHYLRTFPRFNIPYDSSWVAPSTVQTILDHPWQWSQLLFHQMRETTEVLYKRPDASFFYLIWEHNGSMLLPFLSALTLLGLVYATWKLWDARYGLISIWFWTGLFAVAATIDAPTLQRIVGAWPVVMLFPAALIDRVLAAGWPLNWRLARRWANVPLVALLIFFGTESYNEYFVQYAKTCPFCDPTSQAYHVKEFGQDYRGYQLGVSDYSIYFGYGSTRFVAKGVEGEDVLAAPNFLPLTNNDGKGAGFVVRPTNYEYLPIIRLFYPNGIEEVIRTADGIERFTSYKVSREQMLESQKLNASYRAENEAEPLITRKEPNLGTVLKEGLRWQPPDGLTYPATATWTGALVAPAYGAYTIEIRGTGDTKLLIDGRVVFDEATQLQTQQGIPGDAGGLRVEVVLAKGIHDVELSGTLRDSGSEIMALWGGSGMSTDPIDQQYIYNGPTGGLSGEMGSLGSLEALKSDDPFVGLPRQMWRSDPFLGFRDSNNAFGPAPFVVRWQGEIIAPVAGDYIFSPTSNGPIWVEIDGQTVIDNQMPTGVAVASGQIMLDEGPHQIDVRYAWQTGTSRLELFWLPPGGGRSLIPPTALRPKERSWLRAEKPDAPIAQIPQEELLETYQIPSAVIGGGNILDRPRGIAVDRDGNIYVGDRGNHRVVVFSPDGRVLRTWGKTPAQGSEGNVQPGEFSEIIDLAVGNDDMVYVMDDGSKHLQVFDREGKFQKMVDGNTIQLTTPDGIDVASDGTIYIADIAGSRVVKLPPLSTIADTTNMADKVTVITAGEMGELVRLEQPVDVVAGIADGELYSADLRNRILELNAVNSITRQWSVQVENYEGGSRLAISPDGSVVYMSEPGRKRILVVDVASDVITSFGGAGEDAGQFEAPSGLDVGPDGKLYVVDRINNNVQVFDVKK